ncbi:MAG: hypothetical protein KC766_38090 [Myxococcales bacterium]|nr:hypothetical protein [Myxococcales bacterium]
MSQEQFRAQFPANLRKQWEIDRILVEEERPDGSGKRLAIDLRAGYSSTQRGMGSGSPFLSRKVPVEKALVEMTPHLEGATVERVDLWGANLNNAALDAILGTPWFRGVRILNLGANRLTSKAVTSLAKHPIAGQLEDLTLSYNKLGNALAKAAFPELISLELVYCGLDDKALVALGKAPLPKLRRVMLDGAAAYISLAKLAKATHDGSAGPHAEYDAKALESFGRTPLGEQLETLGLGTLTIGEPQARAIADRFPALQTLDLTAATLSASAVGALGKGSGLGALKRLALQRTFAPNYAVDGQLQTPSQETADALASLAGSRFAATLEDLVLNQIAVGPAGLQALCAGRLSALKRLEMRSCQLGDAGMRALGDSALPLTQLFLDGNGLSGAGADALTQGRVAETLEVLALNDNSIAGGVSSLARLTKLEKLSLTRCELDDSAAATLVDSGLVNRLQALFLVDNLIGDRGADALIGAAPPSLQRLALQKNCLSPQAVVLATQALGPRVSLAEQDPSKLPPAAMDNPSLVFKTVAKRAQPAHTAPVDGLRRHLPDGQLSRDKAYPSWLFAFPASGSGKYSVVAYDVERDLLVKPEPPILNGLPYVVPSPDGEWLAVKAFRDGVYAVRTEDGASTRIADTLTHQEGGVVFCDGHIVALDADTEADDWQGRLQVFGFHGGEWVLEHSVAGFFKVFDELVPLASHRMFAVVGSAGMFFCAVRGKELRYLGRLNKKYAIYDFEGEPTVDPTWRSSAALPDVDRLLDEAFASGTSPSSIDLPEESWR